jgi:hypothetical protein
MGVATVRQNFKRVFSATAAERAKKGPNLAGNTRLLTVFGSYSTVAYSSLSTSRMGVGIAFPR